jgi:hypothetical protein
VSKKDRDKKRSIREQIFGKGWTLGNFSDLKEATRTGLSEGKKPVTWLEKKGQALTAEEREHRIEKFRKRTLAVATVVMGIWIWQVLTQDFSIVIVGIGSFMLPLAIFWMYKIVVKSVKGELFKKKDKKEK